MLMLLEILTFLNCEINQFFKKGIKPLNKFMIQKLYFQNIINDLVLLNISFFVEYLILISPTGV